MRFLIIVKATAESEAGDLPPDALIREMAAYHEALQGAGVLVDASGLHPSARGWRIRYHGGGRTMVDGPFPETRALVAGYTLIDVPSRAVALDWSRRFPTPVLDHMDGEIEVRQLMDLDEFPPGEGVERFRALGAGSVKPIPDGFRSVTPHLVCAGAAEAIEFYKQAFGAMEVGRLPGPDGRLMHAHIRIGDSPIMLVDEMPEHGAVGPRMLRGSPVTIHLYVDDVDGVVDRAIAAGAIVTMPVADQFWGDRYGQLVDPFGHQWSVATHRREVSVEEMQHAMQPKATPAGV